MKRILPLIFAAIGFAAHAQTIEVTPAPGMGSLRAYTTTTSLCTQTPCEPAGTATIQISNMQGMTLWFGDQVMANGYFLSYYVGTFAGDGQWSQLQKCAFDASTGLLGPCAPTADVILVNITESNRKVCNRSGRGQSCHYLWELTAGEIQR